MTAGDAPHGHGLHMRQWAAADAGELVEIHRDPAMHRWLRVPIHDAGDALRWLDLQHNGWAAGARLSFAVREADDGPIVACVVLSRPRGPGGEVGYWTAAAARGRGIASRAVDSLSRWAFATFATLERLELRHQVDNHASCRVAEKACFALDGVLPAEPPYPLDGHRHVRTRTTFPARECSAVR